MSMCVNLPQHKGQAEHLPRASMYFLLKIYKEQCDRVQPLSDKLRTKLMYCVANYCICAF